MMLLGYACIGEIPIGDASEFLAILDTGAGAIGVTATGTVPATLSASPQMVATVSAAGNVVIGVNTIITFDAPFSGLPKVFFQAPVLAVSAQLRGLPGFTRIEVTEALGILDRMLDAISAIFLGQTGRSGFAVRQAVGEVKAKGEHYIRTSTLGLPLLSCFTAAREAGASHQRFDGVRAGILAEDPISLIATAIVQAGERFALAQMARIVAATTFVSRDDAESMLDRMNAAFDPAEEAAADEHDSANYTALMALHAAVTRDLTDRSLLLPRVISYSFPRSFPSLTLAQRIYQTGARGDEIVAENKIVHPAFCPRDLRCLSL